MSVPETSVLLGNGEKNVEYLVLFQISHQSMPGLIINFNNTLHITF